MTRSLTVLGERLEALVDEFHVVAVDVETEQDESPRGDPTDTVQESQGLKDQVVVVLTVSLSTEIVLQTHTDT